MPLETKLWRRELTNVSPGCEVCPKCEGWGVFTRPGVGDAGYSTCLSCGGSGEVIEQLAVVLRERMKPR